MCHSAPYFWPVPAKNPWPSNKYDIYICKRAGTQELVHLEFSMEPNSGLK